MYLYNRRTFLHKADPISKTIWLIASACWLISLREIVSVLVFCLPTVALVMAVGALRLGAYLRAVFWLTIGNLPIVVYQSIFQPGPGTVLIGIHFSYEGAALGIAILLRALGLIATSFAFASSTSPREIRLVLMQLGVPFRLAHVLYLAMRFVPIFARDLHGIIDAYRLRGIRTDWRSMQKIIVTLVLSELRRADEAALALETRGFGAYSSVTRLDHARINGKGLLLIGQLATIILLQLAGLPQSLFV